MSPGRPQPEAVSVSVHLLMSFPVQAERIMEALELFKEETQKMDDHKYLCEVAGKQVGSKQKQAASKQKIFYLIGCLEELTQGFCLTV